MYLYQSGRRKRTSLALATISCLVPQLAAIWPFPPKRFTGNSLIGAGSMGISDGERVVAFGDFNGDQL